MTIHSNNDSHHFIIELCLTIAESITLPKASEGQQKLSVNERVQTTLQQALQTLLTAANDPLCAASVELKDGTLRFSCSQDPTLKKEHIKKWITETLLTIWQQQYREQHLKDLLAQCETLTAGYEVLQKHSYLMGVRKTQFDNDCSKHAALTTKINNALSRAPTTDATDYYWQEEFEQLKALQRNADLLLTACETEEIRVADQAQREKEKQEAQDIIDQKRRAQTAKQAAKTSTQIRVEHDERKERQKRRWQATQQDGKSIKNGKHSQNPTNGIHSVAAAAGSNPPSQPTSPKRPAATVSTPSLTKEEQLAQWFTQAETTSPSPADAKKLALWWQQAENEWRNEAEKRIDNEIARRLAEQAEKKRELEAINQLEIATQKTRQETAALVVATSNILKQFGEQHRRHTKLLLTQRSQATATSSTKVMLEKLLAERTTQKGQLAKVIDELAHLQVEIEENVCQTRKLETITEAAKWAAFKTEQDYFGQLYQEAKQEFDAERQSQQQANAAKRSQLKVSAPVFYPRVAVLPPSWEERPFTAADLQQCWLFNEGVHDPLLADGDGLSAMREGLIKKLNL